jgi:hypothetical protein
MAKAGSGGEGLVGWEEHTLGLSPAYWSHVPLTVRQVHELKLYQGIHCLLQKQTQQRDDSVASTSSSLRILPLSKCCLVGLIVAVEQRGLHSVVYVLDDGTGLIDCLYWQDEDTFGLPSLTEIDTQAPVLTVGTRATVYGRIQCVAVGVRGGRPQNHTGGDHGKLDSSTDSGVNSKQPLAVPCLREIHATLVLDANESMPPPSLGGPEDIEGQHWRKAVAATSTLHPTAPEMIHLLGPEIAPQIAERTMLPAVDDSDGAWRVFGSLCRCRLAYKERLLYCHCQATAEVLDPKFQYRDTLLENLLERERSQADGEPLRFQFPTIQGDAVLDAVAARVTAAAPAAAPNNQRLVMNTFRALRKDGVFFLLDEASDTYLFVTRDRVLMPYVETITSDDIERGADRAKIRRQPPAFIQKVPKQRLQYVRRTFKQLKRTSQQGA